MRNAAMVLGIIGGIVGMVVGFFGYALTEILDLLSGVPAMAAQFPETMADAERWRLAGLLSPILAIAGGAMTPGHSLLGALLLGGSAWGMYAGFDYTLFTMFPIAMCGLAALLALGSGLALARSR
ncbi:hypothetical protein FDP22_06015 [Paroceanicella profunda]|uniref:Uncharacterized protein n=1 Tax=Paroceanicella profunda TaxID=2579971 RepID=A0A5B8FGL4_9RHOB|nr:hypothetical protein [Paroceanicella profunda]QDL91381.1 hypothetical protein FDP22_06015 [Paroceanicella profunda]